MHDMDIPTFEEVAKKVPLPKLPPELPPLGADEVGCGCYRVIANQQTYEDFLAYRQTMHEAGFWEVASLEPSLLRAVCTVTFKKEDLTVGVAFNNYWRKIFLCIQSFPDSLFRTSEQVLTGVPAMPGDTVTVPTGAGNYTVTANNTDKAYYESYRKTLEGAGYTLVAANTEGFDDSVYSATYIKGASSLCVTHVARAGETFLTAAVDQPVSPRLSFCPEEVAANPAGAKTLLCLPELYFFGACFVIREKNGHFIVQDGGTGCETGYFLDYICALAGGETPIIDGWLVTHPHRDHTGVLCAMAYEPKYAERIRVEGIYFSEPCDSVLDLDGGSRGDAALMRYVGSVLRTSAGTPTPAYRPHTGQRYYFNDIIVDILMSQEQLPKESYSGDINDSSTWFLFTIDGQKVLLAGDADTGSMQFIMKAYRGEFFDLTAFSTLHHCHNTKDYFTDYMKHVGTVLGTIHDALPPYNQSANIHLQEVADEWLYSGEGTRELTFPYAPGQSRLLPHNPWIYHKKEA